MEEQEISCARPTGGVVGEQPPSEKPAETEAKKEESGVTIMVGRKAPDFQAPAYFKGKFVSVKLSDYLGKWVVLCFYPGDFTFV